MVTNTHYISLAVANSYLLQPKRNTKHKCLLISSGLNQCNVFLDFQIDFHSKLCEMIIVTNIATSSATYVLL